MNYRSFADLATCVRGNLYRVPDDIDLVVGVPRSGLLAANLIALSLNLKLTDLHGLIADARLPEENLRSIKFSRIEKPSEARHILVVEDSVLSGRTIRSVREQIESAGLRQKVTYCAIYATKGSRSAVDISMEVLPSPRAFEWNLMHRDLLSQCCVDIDGVLCPDPTNDENDDGLRYQRFIGGAPCLVRPTCAIGHLVTARLERYRRETEAWLEKNGIRYSRLHMLDLPDAETRRKLGVHASFKASVYRSAKEAELFVESDPTQAAAIARSAGKPVLCYSTQMMFKPGVSTASVIEEARKRGGWIRRVGRRLVARIGL